MYDVRDIPWGWPSEMPLEYHEITWYESALYFSKNTGI
jgi:hypothetical protein